MFPPNYTLKYLEFLVFHLDGTIFSTLHNPHSADFVQLVEANDDRRRYRTLRHIGVSKAEIRESVMKQLSVVFALPLIVGIMHSFFALTVLKQLLGIDILRYDLLVTAAYFALYVCYYLITVNSYTKIVTSSHSNP